MATLYKRTLSTGCHVTLAVTGFVCTALTPTGGGVTKNTVKNERLKNGLFKRRGSS